MAHRTSVGAPFPVPFPLLLPTFHSGPTSEIEKGEAVPARAGGFRDGLTERLVDLAVALEASVRTDADYNVLALVAADQRRPRQRQPRVQRWLHASFDRA